MGRFYYRRGLLLGRSGGGEFVALHVYDMCTRFCSNYTCLRRREDLLGFRCCRVYDSFSANLSSHVSGSFLLESQAFLNEGL